MVLLVLQIAAGIVLGFLILKHWDALWHWALQIGKAAAIIIAVGAIAGSVVWIIKNHQSDAALTGGTLLTAVAIGLLVKYSARGLGHAYVKSIPYLRRSPRAQRLVWLLGADRSWVAVERTDRQFVDLVGDRLFISIPKRLLFSFMAFVLVAVGIVLSAENLNLIPSNPPNPLYAWEIILGCCSVFIIAIAVWCLLAKPETTTEGNTGKIVKQ